MNLNQISSNEINDYKLNFEVFNDILKVNFLNFVRYSTTFNLKLNKF